MIVAWTTLAAASPGSAGALHMGSLPVPSGTTWVGAASGAAWSVEGEWFGLTPGIEVGGAPTDRTVISVQGGTVLADDPGTSLTTVPLALGARWTFHERPGLRVAATWNSVAVRYWDPEPRFGDESFLWTGHSPGLALDAGGERVRFDLSVPVWGITSWDRYVGLAPSPFPMGATIGLGVQVAEGHRLRFGLPELFQWSWRHERVYLDLGGLPLGVVGAVWAKVGVILP